MSFYEDMVKALTEAIDMERGTIPTKEIEGMLARTIAGLSFEEEPLPDEVKAIERAEKSFAQGEYYTHEQVWG